MSMMFALHVGWYCGCKCKPGMCSSVCVSIKLKTVIWSGDELSRVSWKVLKLMPTFWN